MTDAMGNVTTYGIDPNTSLTQWVRYSGDSEQERTEYTYDEVFHLTAIRRMKGTETIETIYEYDQDRVESLESPSGTRYNLEYGAFGQMDQIRVGSSTLAEYTYSEDANRYLLRMDYGNGDYRTYGYDSYGRMIRTGYEDETVSGEYQYNSDGYLGRVTDHLSCRVTKYLYDLSGRSAGYEASGENFSQKVSYGYDDLSNVTSITEKLNGLTYISSFSYDRDNRIIGSENRREGSQIAGETYRMEGRVLVI